MRTLYLDQSTILLYSSFQSRSQAMSVDISLESLSTVEKLALMERLWIDLSRHPEDVPSPAWHGAVLEERREAVRQGRTNFVAWEDAKKRLQERHG
jgi:putative addiction module component (TIGR02574 family)